MKVAIAGSSGLLGTALGASLAADGHDIVRLVRREASGPDERPWDPGSHVISGPGLDDVDAVVNLAGAGIGNRPWTSGYRRTLLTSRVEATRTVAEALADAPRRSEPRTFLVPSAVGVYGADRGEEVLDEGASVGDDFLARVCRLTEAAARPAADAGVRVVALRTGIVLSSHGGFLAMQRPLYLAGLGGPIDSGEQWLSWIAREDHVRAQRHLLEDSDLEGPVNLTAPGAVRQREFARAYAASLGRPCRLRLPTAVLVPVLGPDMVAEVVRAGQRVVPDRLLRDGFTFTQPRLVPALAEVRAGRE